jgi:hypothetical protein
MKLDSINTGLRFFKSQKFKSKYTILLVICNFALINTSQAQNLNSLVWTEQGSDTINSVNVNGSGLTVLQNGLSIPSGIAVTSTKKIYWTEWAGVENVRSVNLDGSAMTTIIANDANANVIAIDEINAKIYWTDWGDDKVSRANLDGSNVEVLIDSSTGILPEGIALDVANGHIYIGNELTIGIMRANLDGSGLITLEISTNKVRAVELDLNANKIYWTEFSSGELNRANLDGSDLETLYTDAVAKPWGIALDITKGLIYWTEFSGGTIKSANLNGGNVVEIVSGLQQPTYIDIYSIEQVFAHGFEGCDFVYRDADADDFGDPAIQMESCDPIAGFVSNKLDCDDTDDQIKPGAFDDPDNSFVDQNCDGIDGDVSEAIFVSLTDGDNNNPGTIASPIRDINIGITQAIALAKTQVYVAQSTYQELVILADGVSLYGGYNDQDNWTRSANKSIILSAFDQDTHRIAISGQDINLTTVVDNFNITTTNATMIEVSNIGVHCINCNGLVITNNTINVGDAVSGATGANGLNGRAGLSGRTGDPACDSINCGLGAAPRISPFFRDGGGGGRGGYDTENGIDGLSGSFGSPGGIGAVANICGATLEIRGGTGTDGADGTDGFSGGIGSNGFSISSGYRIGNSGSSGTDGFHGNGGGGGGGGGGASISTSCFNVYKGAGGGGGGTGGEAGKSGSPGEPGGSVFGIFLLNSPDATTLSNDIFLGALGIGGTGGVGGAGGRGGGIGLGGVAFFTGPGPGPGGNGGNGGDGGDGGDGGQGADGVSEAVFNN